MRPRVSLPSEAAISSSCQKRLGLYQSRTNLVFKYLSANPAHLDLNGFKETAVKQQALNETSQVGKWPEIVEVLISSANTSAAA